jgi:hypothetical protein
MLHPRDPAAAAHGRKWHLTDDVALGATWSEI